MYERFFSFRDRPFSLSPDPEYLYPSRVHREALDYLRFGIESHAGFIVITGAIGSGKTTLLQVLLRNLDGQTTVIRLVNTLLTGRELLESMLLDLNVSDLPLTKPPMLRELAHRLIEQRARGHRVLVVIDEAQNLSHDALEELRMLSNLETEKSKLLQIVLVGQPDLRDKLDQPTLEQLCQRVTVRYHIEPLDAPETANYVNHRLKRAAIGAPLTFPRDVTDMIHARSGGIPRMINVISDAVLLLGYAEGRRLIDTELAEAAVEELEESGVLRSRAVTASRASVPGPVPAPTRAAVQAPVHAAVQTPIQAQTPPVAPARVAVLAQPPAAVPAPAEVRRPAAQPAQRREAEALNESSILGLRTPAASAASRAEPATQHQPSRARREDPAAARRTVRREPLATRPLQDLPLRPMAEPMWDRDLVLNQQAQAAAGRPTTAQVLAKGSTRVATVTAAAPPITRSGAVYRSQADKSNGTWSWMKDFLFGPSTQTRRG